MSDEGIVLLSDEAPIVELDEIRQLIAVGQERGFLTFAEIEACLEEVEVTKEQVQELRSYLDEQGIAVVNDLAAPVDVPVTFKITADTVMNSFFIPSLAGQIYAMPGMETELHAVCVVRLPEFGEVAINLRHGRLRVGDNPCPLFDECLLRVHGESVN